MKKLFTLIAALVCAVCVNAQTTTTLWEGNTTFDESWSGSIVVGTVSNVKAGDKLILTAKSIPAVSWQWGSQLFVKTARGGWDAISSTINVNSETENQYEVLVNDDEITITEKDASGNIIDDAVKTSILKEITEKGLVIQGIDAEITKIELKSSVETNEVALELVEGHTILSSSFDKYPDDYEVKISFANNTDPYASRNGWGIGGFANADNWTPTYSINGLDGATFDVYCTIGDFKTAAKNGTDSYVEGQYHGTGITFNIYNDCKIIGVYVLIPASDPTAISNTLAPAKAENNDRYNLLGVKNGNGVYIMNGKKYLK